jgi:hypothetical protein
MDQSEFGFPKLPRIVDEELLEQVRKLPCMACGIRPSDAHHLTSRGAGGSDVAVNVMPLCREHHSAYHQNPGYVISAFPCVRSWLEMAERQDILDRFAGKKKPQTEPA